MALAQHDWCIGFSIKTYIGLISILQLLYVEISCNGKMRGSTKLLETFLDCKESVPGQMLSTLTRRDNQTPQVHTNLLNGESGILFNSMTLGNYA